jgi:hypothetical protein
VPARAELGRSTSLKAHSMFSATSRRYFSLAAAQISALTRSQRALNCTYALLSRGGRAEPHFWTLMRFDALLRPIRYPVAHRYLSYSLYGIETYGD